mgnify:CR=1 FL=1
MRSEWTLSGKEAVLRARQSMELGDAFHAYIIDWRLPDMNGIEVTRQIRSMGDHTPIIILTAYDWADIEVEPERQELQHSVRNLCLCQMSERR